MAGRQRTTFAKLQRERARQEKQAAKRARRQGLTPEGGEEPRPSEGFEPGFGPDGEVPAWLEEASASSSNTNTNTTPSAPDGG